jgi:hypothetical protein
LKPYFIVKSLLRWRRDAPANRVSKNGTNGDCVKQSR